MRVPEVAFAGLTLGLLQGLSVEHTCSFLPLMSSNVSQNILLGSVWAITHSVGVLIVLSFLFTLKRFTPFVYPFAIADTLYAVTLVAIGAFTLWTVFARPKCASCHNHKEEEEDEAEIAALSLLERQPPSPEELTASKKTAAVSVAASAGFLHGLSGCGCTFAAVPLLAVSATSTLLFYAASLVVGTLVASVAVATAASTLVKTPDSLKVANAVGGALAVGAGLFFAVHSRHHRGEVL